MIAGACMEHGVDGNRLVIHSDYNEKKQMPKFVHIFCPVKEIALKTSA
jgi:hypothetical protein